MAEEEKIVHHAKEAVHALTNKEKKWKEKLKDFLLEILIIIIAVSITLWFHNWNDRKHEREQEKEFLIGIRNDLIIDTSNLAGYCLRDYRNTMNYYDTVFFKMAMKNKIDKSYINDHQNFLTNTAYFIYNDSRFESFKSSGNLKLIENQKLQNDITYLYTIAFPVQKQNDIDLFTNRRKDYDREIGSQLKYIRDTGENYYQDVASIINKPVVEYQLAKCIEYFQEREIMIDRTIKETSIVIQEINKELKDRFDYDVLDKK